MGGRSRGTSQDDTPSNAKVKIEEEPPRRRDRSRESRREGSRDRSEYREKHKARDRSHDRDRKRSRDYDDRSPERKRDRSKDSHRSKRRSRSRSRNGHGHRHRDDRRERRRDRSRDKYRDRSRDKYRERSRDRDRDKYRERHRDRDRDNTADRESRHGARERTRDRSRSPYAKRKKPASRSPSPPPYRSRRGKASPSPSRSHRQRSRSPAPRKRRKHSPSPSPSPPPRSRKPLPDQEISFRGLDDSSKPPTKYGGAPPDREKPNFKPTGLLAKEANKVAGTKISLKYHEPPEARKPPSSSRWYLWTFKGGPDSEPLEKIELNAQSCWLLGRAAEVADIRLEHPSASSQHAAIQFRYIARTVEDEAGVRRQTGKVKPYIIDLGSSNGTELNDEPVAPERYVELRDKDILRFGGSEREYMLMLA
jgi:smad nuclear-interacting protein 1